MDQQQKHEEAALPKPLVARKGGGKESKVLGRPGYQNVTIGKESVGAVSAAVSALAPDGHVFEPGSVLTLTDSFSGRSVEVPASHLEAVGAVLSRLVTKKPDGRKATYEAAPEASGKPSRAAAKTKKAKPAAKAKEAAKPAVEAAPAKTAKGSRKPAKAAAAPKAASRPAPKRAFPVPDAARGPDGLPPRPKWFEEFVAEARAAVEKFPEQGLNMEPVPLAMSPSNEREVLARAKGGEREIRWGFEVTSAATGEHVTWVVAYARKQLLVSGMPGETEAQLKSRAPQSVAVGILGRISTSLAALA